MDNGDEKQNRHAELGQRIRVARRRRGKTLAELADVTGFSISYISQVERGLSAPSLAALKRIADGLGLQAYTFMFEDEESTLPDSSVGSRPVAYPQAAAAVPVPRDRRKSIILPGSDVQYALLTPDLKRRTAVVTFKAPPGTSSGDPFVHEGEEVGYVIKGTLDVIVAGVTYSLEAGDSIFINSTVPHRWHNQGSEEAELIWVMTPPSF